MATITKSDVFEELDRLNNILRTEEDITLCKAADDKKTQVLELLRTYQRERVRMSSTNDQEKA